MEKKKVFIDFHQQKVETFQTLVIKIEMTAGHKISSIIIKTYSTSIYLFCSFFFGFALSMVLINQTVKIFNWIRVFFYPNNLANTFLTGYV